MSHPRKKKRISFPLLLQEIAAEDLPSYEIEGYRSYYNESVFDWSRHLYNPDGRDCFNMNALQKHSFKSKNRDMWATCSMEQNVQQFHHNVVVTNPLNVINNDETIVTRKLKLYFNSRQRDILRRWIGSCRKIYNLVTADFNNSQKLNSKRVIGN